VYNSTYLTQIGHASKGIQPFGNHHHLMNCFLNGKEGRLRMVEVAVPEAESGDSSSRNAGG